MKVESVVSYLQEIESNKCPNIFRGHSNSSWKLLPSIARLDISQSPVKHDNGWQGIENHLLDEFKKYSLMHLEREPKRLRHRVKTQTPIS